MNKLVKNARESVIDIRKGSSLAVGGLDSAGFRAH